MYISNALMLVFFLLQNYFGDPWNIFDFVIVLGSFIEIIFQDVGVDVKQSGVPNVGVAAVDSFENY